MAPGSASSQERLISTYYDTQDLALKQRGLTLRIRAQAGRFIQTVKAGDLAGANILTRGTAVEIEPVPGTHIEAAIDLADRFDRAAANARRHRRP
jgi:uncharacterized protein YjbK